jgi:hypothetical protein
VDILLPGILSHMLGKVSHLQSQELLLVSSVSHMS